MNADARKAFADLKRRVALMVGRGRLTGLKDAGVFQMVQADRLADETADNLERFGSYGFTSAPHVGAELIIVSAGGVRSHGIVIACEDRRYRLKGLDAGEVALYDDLGQVIRLGRDAITVSSPNPIRVESEASIEIAAPEATITANTITLDADNTELTGNLSIGGNLTVDGLSNLAGPTSKAVKLVDDTPSLKVKA